jgi:hypothetical protein
MAWSVGSEEEVLPPQPKDLELRLIGTCIDNGTEEKGFCTVFRARTTGTHYIVFEQHGEIQFLRIVPKNGPNKTIFANDHFATY